MLLHDDDTVLWLRNLDELHNKSAPRHAILWPAIEYTALVSTGALDPSGRELDPFQRAVLGLARNGVIDVGRQAELLDLHPGFISHLQDRLQAEMLIDKAGRPRDAVVQAHRTTATAVRLYQDPFTGALWSRYATEARRRSLPVEESDHGVVIGAGTTGDPVSIRVFVVRQPEQRPAPPSADDARGAIRDWSRVLRQEGASRKDTIDDGPVQLIPDSFQRVFLCCPNGRSNSREPEVSDPFGGPTNRPLHRSIAGLAATLEPLGRWLYGDAAPTVVPAPGQADITLTGQLAVVATQLQSESARIGARHQMRQDIDAIGHEAIARIWTSGTERIEDVAPDLIADRSLLDGFATTYGFHRGSVPLIADLRAICKDLSAPLAERAAAMLMRFQPSAAGPMHRVAARCPDLYQLLRESDAGGSIHGLESRSTAVFALAEEADRMNPQQISMTGADHVQQVQE